MKQQTIDEKEIVVHFKNSITHYFCRRKDYVFSTPGFAILQDRATREAKYNHTICDLKLSHS
jgi:hypothetical protein